MSTQAVAPAIEETEKWLEANWEKITSFWLYADWRNWARFDLYAHFMKGIARYASNDSPRGDFTVSHSVPIWGDDEPEIDITLASINDRQMKEVAIWICAERPNENDTSFPDFVEKFKSEWKQVQDLVEKNGGGDMEGQKLLFLGLGEKAYDEEEFEFDGLKAKYKAFGGTSEYEGSVYMYYLWLDLPEAK